MNVDNSSLTCQFTFHTALRHIVKGNDQPGTVASRDVVSGVGVVRLPGPTSIPSCVDRYAEQVSIEFVHLGQKLLLLDIFFKDSRPQCNLVLGNGFFQFSPLVFLTLWYNREHTSKYARSSLSLPHLLEGKNHLQVHGIFRHESRNVIIVITTCLRVVLVDALARLL